MHTKFWFTNLIVRDLFEYRMKDDITMDAEEMGVKWY